jgi:uncharacterized protein YdeI (YjbR/CyaY-like superfamily)
MNPEVDNYLAVGCGRCPLGGTPDCKVHNWPEALAKLRAILLECGLTEEVKWGFPCYTVENKNIVLLSAFKEYCALSFFKGALLEDAQGILFQQTKNVQSARLVRFTNVQEIVELEPILREYIEEAIEVEKAGLQVEHKKTAEFDVPEEFQTILDDDPAFNAAFAALTPGRQRGYLLYFAGAKQPKTRTARVEKWMPQIFAGKGLHDR